MSKDTTPAATTKQDLQITDKRFYQPLKEDWIAQSGLSEGEFMKEVSFAIQHIHKTPMLQKCTQVSILRSVINLAQVGLTLNPISKFAYLIPRYNSRSKEMECVLEPDYRGLTKLLTDSGAVTSIMAEVIYEGDKISIDKASVEKVKEHVPHFLNGKPKGKIIAVYSLATLPDGSKHFEGMSYEDVMEIRDRSESYKAFKAEKISTCIWITDEQEMCRKTVIKRHYKYLPKSAGLEKFEKAVELDNTIHGFEEEMDYGMFQFVESLIHNSTFNDEKKQKLLSEMGKLGKRSDAYKMIEELKEHQPIMGRDVTPHTVKEQGIAIQNAADLDDFKERNK